MRSFQLRSVQSRDVESVSLSPELKSKLRLAHAACSSAEGKKKKKKLSWQGFGPACAAEAPTPSAGGSSCKRRDVQPERRRPAAAADRLIPVLLGGPREKDANESLAKSKLQKVHETGAPPGVRTCARPHSEERIIHFLSEQWCQGPGRENGREGEDRIKLIKCVRK